MKKLDVKFKRRSHGRHKRKPPRTQGRVRDYSHVGTDRNRMPIGQIVTQALAEQGIIARD